MRFFMIFNIKIYVIHVYGLSIIYLKEDKICLTNRNTEIVLFV